MYETIKTAKRPILCDLCGFRILPGEHYRFVREEYSLLPYHEHIRCPGAAAVVTPRFFPTPVKPGMNCYGALCPA